MTEMSEWPKPHGFPLFDRGRNLSYVAFRMNSDAQDIWDEVAPVSEAEEDVAGAMDSHAQALEYYSNLITILLSHGTRGFYNDGCHCEWCSAANTQYYKRRSGKSRIKFVQSILEDAL